VNEHAPIPLYEAAQLEEYFSLATESSTAGPTLERARAFGVAATEARVEHAQRNAAARRAAIAGGASAAALPWDLEPLTAQMTVEDPLLYGPEGRYEVDYGRSALQAFVSRRLGRMMSAGRSDGVVVLRTYFGIEGNHFAVGFTSESTGRPVAPLPRVFALLHLVPSGRRILERGQALLSPGVQSLSEYARMRVHVQDRGRGLYSGLRGLFAAGEIEIAALWRAAGEAWNAARGGR